MENDETRKPSSARNPVDANGRTSDLHYSRGHLERLKQLKRDGKRIKLPPGVTLDDDAPAARGSTSTNAPGSLNTNAGTAGSE